MRKAIRTIASLCLTITMILGMTTTAFASAEVSQLKAVLSENYGVEILLDENYTDEQKMEILQNTDAIFKSLGESFVKEVIAFYPANGYTISLKYAKSGQENISGSFSLSNKQAQMDIVTVMNKDSKVEVPSYTVKHEFAHMVNCALDIKFGEDYMKSDWQSCGEVYITDYASKGYYEDIAETFAYIACSDDTRKILQEAIKNDATASLSKKVNQIDLMCKYFESFSGINAMYGFQNTNIIFGEPTNANIFVNGVVKEFEVYTINDNNYFKLRDMAKVVNGTDKQFEVSWDKTKNAIQLISNRPYTAVGNELAKGDGTSKFAIPSTSVTYKDGQVVQLTAYTINGNNYFKLRDLCQVFNIGVTWNESDHSVGIDTSIGYKE